MLLNAAVFPACPLIYPMLLRPDAPQHCFDLVTAQEYHGTRLLLIYWPRLSQHNEFVITTQRSMA